MRESVTCHKVYRRDEQARDEASSPSEAQATASELGLGDVTPAAA